MQPKRGDTQTPRGSARTPWAKTRDRALPLLLAAGALALGALALGGCGGSSTKTVSVSNAAGPTGDAQSTTSTSTTSSAPSAAATNTTTTPTTQAGAEATHTTTAPAFTKASTSSEGLSEALAVVRAHGYTVSDTSTYHADQTLRVLIGARTGSADGYGQQAFFFVDGRYIGTDSSEPSATVKVVGQSDTEVTLAYPLYKAHDSLCCPGGGQATVRFQLNNGQLVALDPIPPVSSSTGLSRQ